MKRAAVLKRIRKAAKQADVDYVETEGSNHTRLQVGAVRTTVGRHSEIVDLMAETIFKQLEPELGERWWK